MATQASRIGGALRRRMQLKPQIASEASERCAARDRPPQLSDTAVVSGPKLSSTELSGNKLSGPELSSKDQKWVAVARILRARGNKGEVAAELLTDFPERLKKIDAVYLGNSGGDVDAARATASKKSSTRGVGDDDAASGERGSDEDRGKRNSPRAIGDRNGESKTRDPKGEPATESENTPRRVNVKNFWLSQNHRGQGVFHFAGCDSISEAEKLRGLDVLLPFEQRVTLPAGQYFVSDLVGCSVFENLADNSPGPSAVSSSPCSLATAPALLGTVSDVQFTGEDTSGTPLLAVDTPSGEMLIPLAEDICKRIDVAARRIDVVLPEGLRDLHRD